LPTKRRVLTADGAGRIAVIEDEVKDPGPGEIAIEVRASMVSPGSELGRIPQRRTNPTDAAPRSFGYSNAGVITACGSGVEGLEPGVRVACMGGGYAEHATHAVVPQNLAVPIPVGVSDEDASSIHLVATALNAVRRMVPEIGEYVAVVGLGLVGQFSLQWARASVCHVMGIDRMGLRLQIAEACGTGDLVNASEQDPRELIGEFTRGRGLDAGIIAFGGDGTGALVLLADCVKRAPDTHRMGRVVIVGGARIDHVFAAALGNLDVRSAARTGPGYHDEAWEKGADYAPVFVRWDTRRNLEECLRFMASGHIQVDSMITHRVSLDDAPDACEILIQTPTEALGVVFLPGGGS
tara:strand:+ start:2709 stop:3764 length:1056 start_codon:yes stop_codon:yes gene_type:complete